MLIFLCLAIFLILNFIHLRQIKCGTLYSIDGNEIIVKIDEAYVTIDNSREEKFPYTNEICVINKNGKYYHTFNFGESELSAIFTISLVIICTLGYIIIKIYKKDVNKFLKKKKRERIKKSITSK